VEVAVSTAVAGDIVLLSPAAAAGGWFKNDFERGDQFAAEVNKLK